ncbi:hypothetical protein [Gimesia alba]|uniref:hypothetical protein n=1 Tax=Gimesia alba TaxID=2527973 RepID=UPI0011A6BC22|nr:hypothetical protein [Gimesia alba]
MKQDIRVSYKDISHYAGVSTRSIPKALAEAESGKFICCVTPGIAKAPGQRGQAAEYRLQWGSDGDKYTNAPQRFTGFYTGEGYRSPIPNGYFDVVVPRETLAMAKVVGTVLRHTVGYANQFGTGRRSHAPLPYSYIHQFANLNDPKTLSDTLKKAQQKGYIKRVTAGCFDTNAGKQSRAASYAVIWQPEAAKVDKTAKTLAACAEDGKIPSEKTAESLSEKDGNNPSDRKTGFKDSSKQQAEFVVAPEFQESFQLLMQVDFNGERFSQETALQLAQSRGLSEIQQQIAWLPKRKADRNPLGMLRIAIEQNWSAPTEVQERERNRANAHKEKKRELAKATRMDEIDRAKQERRFNRQQAMPWWNGLSREKQAAIKQEAYERLDSDFHRKRFRTNDKFCLEKCLDELCLQEGIVPAMTSVSN